MVDQPTRTIELVRRAQDGDRRSLERILERYYPRLHRIVRVRLGARLRTELDSTDILQETLMVAANKIHDFEPRNEASLINWLSKLAEHKITDQASYHNAKKRKSGRKISFEGNDPNASTQLVLEPADEAPGPPEAACHTEETEVVEECMRELPEHYRNLILMRNYAGMSWAEIGQETDKSDAAARMMHVKAIVELGKLMRKRLPPAR